MSIDAPETNVRLRERIEQLESALRSLVETGEWFRPLVSEAEWDSDKRAFLHALDHARSILPPEKEGK